MHRSARRDAWLQVAAFAALLLALAGPLAISFIVTPGDLETGRFPFAPQCMWRTLFDVACPTCGLSRAFAALSHGMISDAFGYHRVSPILYAGWWLVTLFCVRGCARAALQLARGPGHRS